MSKQEPQVWIVAVPLVAGVQRNVLSRDEAPPAQLPLSSVVPPLVSPPGIGGHFARCWVRAGDGAGGTA